MKNAATELQRIESEAGGSLPTLDTPQQRAQRLLEHEAPPTGRDLELCRAVASGTEGDIIHALAEMDGLYTQHPTKIVLYPDGTVMTCQMQDGIMGEGYVVAYHHPGGSRGRRMGWQWV